MTQDKKTDFYPSHDYPIEGQLEGDQCPWGCGRGLGNDPAIPHVRQRGCMSLHEAKCKISVVASDLELVAKILRGKACVFGEEPLDGAMARLDVARSLLAEAIAMRSSPGQKP